MRPVTAVNPTCGHGIPELLPPLQRGQDQARSQQENRTETPHRTAALQKPKGRRAVRRVHEISEIQNQAHGRMQMGFPHAPENRTHQTPLDKGFAIHAEHGERHETRGRLI